MKILYVSTVLKTMTFFIRQIDRLHEQGHIIEIAANTQGQSEFCSTSKPCALHPIDFSRSPASRSNIHAYRQLRTLISQGGYDLIHTHTPIASALVRLACRDHPSIKIVYTAHGFHFYTGAPWKNWLMYYPLEKWLAKYTDVLITINQEDYERARTKLPARAVEYIPGVGIEIEKFRDALADKIALKQELGLPSDAFILLSVGELNKNKNHEAVVRVMGELKDPKLHYLICGTGPMRTDLLRLAETLGISQHLHLLGFRSDIAQMYKISDLFVFPSLREGLPVSLMEAMAAGLPALASRIRGNKDLFDGASEEWLFDPHDVSELTDKLRRMIHQKGSQPGYDPERIRQFSTSVVLEKMDRIYRI